LYRSNKDRQNELSGKSFVDLFVKDIIFYQRPLRSQKSTIGNCTLEFRIYKDKNGNKIKEYLQAVPKSNPIYQEFRLWQWLFNLKIYRKEDDVDVTSQFVADVTDKESLFDFLNDRKEVKQDALIKYLLEKTGLKGKLLTAEVAKYRWNYVEDKEYPCNQTGTQIKNRLAKVENVPADFFTPEIEYNLWHIIYSVTDKSEFEKALKTFANKHCLDENSFVENFKKFPPFKSEYGAYSEKAIKKLLPLMRLGKYWDLSTIDGKTKNRIDKILTGEYDETIKNRVREKAINLTNETDLQGLQLWLAQYIVYDRHSESNSTNKWNSVADLEKYLEDFRQHSLRNPIVEQVITETLRVVRDIWKKYGELSEIHIELGREMKNTAEDRKKITNQVSENENTNLRIKALIMELKENSDGKLDVKEVRPYSPVQQDILKIYEEYVLQNNEEYDGKDNEGKDKFKKIPIPEDILKISKTAQPSKSELQRYKLWLEQKYRSPYTGQLIPLGKLFTEEYEIEHIIPKSRYFDDSFSNKVICESVVNKNPFKDNQLGLEFIKREGGRIVDALSNKHKTVKIFTETEYRDFVNEHYAKNRSKKVKLLLEEIPDKMIERQMNDTRYISKFISSVLSNIVRIDDDQAKKIIEDAEILAKKETDKEKAEEIRKKAKSAATDDGINSKNLISCNGKITTALKQDWGLNDIWNDLIFPRFERMNALTNSTAFTAWNEQYQKFLPTIPLELSKGFQKKRIDHRHHAMDAIIIACATRSHVNYLNNLSAKVEASDNEEKKKKQIELRNQIKNTLCYKKFDENGNYKWIFKKPWGTDDKQALIKSAIDFTVDARNALGKIVISFKQNLRVINKATNRYKKFKDGKKTEVKQEGINWAIRKPLHKDTAFAKVSLRKIKTIRFNVALKDWKSIVDKELKEKIKRLSSEYGKFDEKLVDKYFKDRKYQFKDVDISKVEVYYFDTDNAAVRKPLDASFTEKTIQESVTDTGIQKILLNHLLAKDNKPELAFSPEGIEEMNKNIAELNGGKSHQPIYKVRVYEPIGNKFPIGYLGNKKAKFVEAAKGTNLFFAIYADKNGNRSYETIPLNIVIERLKQGLKEVPETNEKGHKLLFSLSPNDLVYVPTEEEKENSVNVENINPNQIYKTVSSSGSQCFFVQHLVATSIVNKVEFSALNKMERSIEGIMIKEVGIKIMVDRMGRLKIL
jgi:CRISPR-associated endonuclease Csn1